MLRFRLPAGVALACLGACSATELPAPVPADSPAMDVHSKSRPERVRVVHASLDLLLDFEARRVLGSATLDLERSDPHAPLVVDTQDLEIGRVTGADGRERRHRLGAADPILGSPLAIDLEPGDGRVRIEYATTAGAQALQWLAPEQTTDRRSAFLFTQGQSILTRSWIPIQDSPGVRLTYDARVRAPAGHTALMSAEQLGPDAEGAFRFRMPQPIPPYLIALASGVLEFRAISPRSGVWAEPSVVEAALHEFADTEAMIRSAEELFGPYRWGRYDVLVLPAAFPFGGMENPRLTFATPTVLAGDRSLVALIAHELAHSWSGNLVTNATWSDFWLNEGFTVYCESRIMEAIYGRERAAMELELERANLVREMAELEPWEQVLHVDLAGKHPDDGFSGVPYTKGALFLKRLEEVHGRERLDRFLRGWFDGHAFRSVTTETFVAELRSGLLDADPARAAAVDVERWIGEPGLPADAPDPRSRALAAVAREVERWQQGADDVATEGWVTQQWIAFLEGIAGSLDARRMARLDELHDLTDTRNCEIACVWLRLAVQHGYAPADARLEEFLTTIGRRKFLEPLYKELAKSPAGRVRALAIYERARPRYHAVAVRTIDEVLGTSG